MLTFSLCNSGEHTEGEVPVRLLQEDVLAREKLGQAPAL